MLIVDSGVWIDYFGRNPDDQGATTGQPADGGRADHRVGDLILHEVLRGFRHTKPFEQAQRLLGKLPCRKRWRASTTPLPPPTTIACARWVIPCAKSNDVADCHLAYCRKAYRCWPPTAISNRLPGILVCSCCSHRGRSHHGCPLCRFPPDGA